MTMYEAQIRDCSIGENVTIVKPVNMYECAIGAHTKIGPFVEIQSHVIIGTHCNIQSHSFIGSPLLPPVLSGIRILNAFLLCQSL